MPRVVVQPKGIELEVAPGESIFDAARRLGYSWPTVCDGLGTCSTCYLTVDAGLEHLSPVSAYEQEGLDRLGAPEGPQPVRLACQATVDGNVVVTKRGVRELKSPEEEQWAKK